MPYKPMRPCVVCKRLTKGSRCEQHQWQQDKQQDQAKRQRRPRASSAEDKRRADAVARHIKTYGMWCPGWQVPAHVAGKLTADHVVPYASVGYEGGPLAVLCVSCNSKKGARVRVTTGGG